MMLIARKGDLIVCPNGHVGGHVLRDISQGETLEPRGDFSLTDAASHTKEGHCCPQCPEKITRYRDGTYQVLTAQGWIGLLVKV